MTVCTAHKYAGPHACPYCERDACRVANGVLRDELAAANTELERRTAWSNEQIAKLTAKLRVIEDAVAANPDTAPESLARSILRVIKEELRAG